MRQFSTLLRTTEGRERDEGNMTLFISNSTWIMSAFRVSLGQRRPTMEPIFTLPRISRPDLRFSLRQVGVGEQMEMENCWAAMACRVVCASEQSKRAKIVYVHSLVAGPFNIFSHRQCLPRGGQTWARRGHASGCPTILRTFLDRSSCIN